MNDKLNNFYELGLVPIPSSIEKLNLELTLITTINVFYDGNDKALKKIYDYFKAEFLSFGFKPCNNNEKNYTKVYFEINDNVIKKEESYSLKVDADGIKLIGSDHKGVFYGVQTLIQLLETSSINNDLKIPGLKIEDEPRFQWRGMMLDVGRHMMPFDFIKRCIDITASHKMNIFHWHLTEDQGWRIPIKNFSKLKSIAAYRKETLIGHYDDKPHKFDGSKYGGYYTIEQINEIIEYAKDRYITIIPEIEMPGHATAALSAYPQLSCTGGPHAAETVWGIHKEVYCAGNDDTFQFLEEVLEQVSKVFPGPYLHIGGDECPKDRWSECEKCQKRIASEGLKDENELQSYFIKRIEKILLKFNKRLIGWDEILEGGLAPNAVVHSWRGMEGGIEAANAGHEVIMSPTTNVYFDYYQLKKIKNEPLAIGGYLPLSKVYDFEPIPEKIDKNKRHLILGGQANLWTEYIRTPEQAEYMLLPRLCALAETVWSQKDKRDYSSFKIRLSKHLERLKRKKINYSENYE